MNKLDNHLNNQELDYIFSTQAIRDKSQKIFDLTLQGKTSFQYHPEKLQEVSDFVLKVISENYPDGNIPFHSRWGHFRVGGVDRVETLIASKMKQLDSLEKARIKMDLVVTSVLLDAGAGSDWKYLEASSQKTYARSEGLGVASLYLFLKGDLSSDPNLMQADAKGLKNLTKEKLEAALQVSAKNPLLGVDGRLQLLHNLGDTLSLEKYKKFFKAGRPGNLMDYFFEVSINKKIKASQILRAVLDSLGPIWPGRIAATINNETTVNLGDVWKYAPLGDELIPLHKLSQWMTYSLIEPILECGLTIEGVEELTGLAEYRNGGLLLDSGLISLKNEADAKESWSPQDKIIIEWRSLTIYLLDLLANQIQKKLGKTPSQFPLGKILEGGTWHAGRRLAFAKRPSGNPPLSIKSDGTVF